MGSQKTILVVDDRVNTLKVLMLFLADNGYQVLSAPSGQEALEIFRTNQDIDLVLADLKMPGMNGLELYRRLNQIRPTPPFIIMTAYASVQTAVKALKEGVTDYLIKPLNFEELPIVLAKACRDVELSRELASLRRQTGKDKSTFHGMIGVSSPMLDIFEMVRTVGPTDASVLITGETGTGKELLARSIHLESNRRDKPLVCINCAALTESLLESELFGYVQGAFTGAVGNKKGRLEMANGGTLFLDEIGNMSLALQSKFLRFLQDGSFEPVGATQPRQVDMRLVAATNADLEAQIASGRFISDLLYRIEVISIHLPPLRERAEDIPLLVEHFLTHYAKIYKKPVRGVSSNAMRALMDYPWPGNVRELKNSLARSVILSKGTSLTLTDLPQKIKHPARPSREAPPPLLREGLTLKDMEAELIASTLKRCQGNKTLAAKMLGISRKGLYEKMLRLGIRK